jgi:hypothetical protein
MPSQKIAAARGIAKSLRPAEDSIDVSIVNAAQLIAAIASARLQVGTALETGHAAYMRAAALLAALSDARDHAVACHRELNQTRDAHGIDEREAGCTLKIARHLTPVQQTAEAA